LKQLLTDELDKVEIGEASDAREVLELVDKKKWDIVVLDINMPGRSGFEVLQELKQRKPKLPVLVLTVYPEDELAMRTLEAGAASFATRIRGDVETRCGPFAQGDCRGAFLEREDCEHLPHARSGKDRVAKQRRTGALRRRARPDRAHLEVRRVARS